MLALLGVCTITVLLVLIMTDRMTPLLALAVVPIGAALLGGFGGHTWKFVLQGMAAIAPVAGMFLFAILFFGVMTDAGLLDPIIARILRLVGLRPKRIVMGTALLALLIHLDGSGAVCFLITIPAMRPLYDRLGMDRRVLACAASMAAGVNVLPWIGPTLRASAALKIPVNQIFTPLIPVQIVGFIYVFAICWWLGRREERRLGLSGTSSNVSAILEAHTLSDEQMRLRRPHLFWPNLALTILVMGTMIAGLAEPVVVFLLGLAAALLLNYPGAREQRARVDAHASAALLMVSVLFAAGAFTGIMKGTGMLTAMATAVVGHIPEGAGSHIPVVLGLVSMPLSLLFDPDSFYFGILPVIAEVTGKLGGHPIQVAQAALLGQMTTGFPVSPLTPATFLILGLSGLELGAHQRFSIPFLFLASIVMTIAAVIFGVIPL